MKITFAFIYFIASTFITNTYNNPSAKNKTHFQYNKTPVNNDLCKMEWFLSIVSINDSVTAISKNYTTNNPTKIKFNTDGTFSGTICGKISGRYSFSDEGNIKIMKLIKSKSKCKSSLSKVQDAFTEGNYEMDITKGNLNLLMESKMFSFYRKTTSKENPMAG
jgi:heat shock protein HslJ